MRGTVPHSYINHPWSHTGPLEYVPKIVVVQRSATKAQNVPAGVKRWPDVSESSHFSRAWNQSRLVVYELFIFWTVGDSWLSKNQTVQWSSVQQHITAQEAGTVGVSYVDIWRNQLIITEKCVKWGDCDCWMTVCLWFSEKKSKRLKICFPNLPFFFLCASVRIPPPPLLKM